tara:strand:- start:5068 stop:5286 length:219 start_codon:yes stop_codon:yes gene_type:complete
VAKGGKRKGAGRPAKRGRKKKYKKKGSQWDRLAEGKIDSPEVGRKPNPIVKNPNKRITNEEYMKRFWASKRK